MFRKLLRESRREDREVGWLPLHNKQLILSISSRLGKGNTVSKAVQEISSLKHLPTSRLLSWLYLRADHSCQVVHGICTMHIAKFRGKKTVTIGNTKSKDVEVGRRQSGSVSR